MFDSMERLSYLSDLAKNNKELRFKELYKLVHRKEFLEVAYMQIARNKGSKTAGVDEKNVSDYEIQSLEKLATKLWDKTYQPLPVRRVEIPKSDGKSKRPLGIPAFEDRIVQSAIKLILEAIYEADFLPVSHGFRPKHSCQTAINSVVNRKFDWVIEGDIKGCFDNIKHEKLLNILRKRIADEKFIQLINKFLKSGYQIGYGTDGKVPVYKTNNGTPQGGIVSPILANIYLHEFDKYMSQYLKNANRKSDKKSKDYSYWENKINRLQKAINENKFPYKTLDPYKQEEGKKIFQIIATKEDAIKEIVKYKKIRSNVPRVDKEELFTNEKYKSFGFIRYADDFVILLGKYTKKDAIAIKQEITEWFDTNLSLTLSQEKTRITHSTKGFEFLGYKIVQRPSKDGLGYRDSFAQIYTPDAKKKNFLNKIDKVIKSNWNAPEYDMIIALNRVISGWSRYHQIANNWKQVGKKMDYLIFWKVMHWMGRKHKASINSLMSKVYKRDPKTGTKRIVVKSSDNTTATIKWCNDFDYVTPKEVSDKIQYGEETKQWMYTDEDESYKEITNLLRNGSSIDLFHKMEDEHGKQCSKCGKEGVYLEIHHTKMVKRGKKKSRTALEQSSQDINKVFLCEECHKAETAKQRKH